MRSKVIVVLVLIILSVGLPDTVMAQSRGLGYVFTAPGAVDKGSGSTLHFGGGGEARIYKGLGAGAEIGFLGPARDMGEGFGVFSANGSYHFRRDQKLVPFVTGGYTLFFRNGSANLGNFGGGVHYWFREGLGVRVEFRDHVQAGPTNFWEFRFGLSFR